jgi:hypothetical protein
LVGNELILILKYHAFFVSLQDLCSELGVEDVEALIPAIQGLTKRLEQANQYQEV